MKQRLILFPLIIMFILPSCVPKQYDFSPPPRTTYTTYEASYSISLSKVERPEKSSKRYGQQKIETISSTESNKYKYVFEDNMVKVFWIVTNRDISFSIQNKTDYSIKIPWDEAVFVDEKRSSHRVIHSGVKYSETANPQTSSIIARKTSIEDTVFPVDYIVWLEGSKEWVNKPFFLTGDLHGPYSPGKYATYESFEEAAKSNIGKTIQVLLPLQIEDVINDYIFSFSVENATCKQETKSF